MTSISQQARPYTFEQVVGQDHVKDVLVAALERGRVGQAYLLSGPRGVGKTTTARLLAMAVNCEAPEAKARPCGVCESCRLVRQNSHPDVTELDAASNNSVEDIRELREHVRLAAMRGGSRVWVLDEAHMLSRAASNALLKTLEEPPERLLFVLATTEPEKLPPTILSRCQHFRFRRLSETEIAAKLGRICEAQGVEAEAAALALVARAADGAMRDAESLLERLLASGRTIALADAERALGLPPQARMEALATRLARADLAGAFEVAGALYRDGFAPSSLIERLLVTLREALYTALGAGRDGARVEAEVFRLELSEPELLRLVHALDDETARFGKRDNLFALEVALIKAHNAHVLNLAPELATEFAAERVAAPQTTASQITATQTTERPGLAPFDPHARPAPSPPRQTAARETPQPVSAQAPQPTAQPTSQATSQPASQAAQPPTASSSPPPDETANAPTAPNAPISWHRVKTEAGAQLKAFLNPAQDEIAGQVIRLSYGERYRFHFNEVKKRLDELANLVRSLYGGGFELIIEGPGETLRKKF